MYLRGPAPYWKRPEHQNCKWSDTEYHFTRYC